MKTKFYFLIALFLLVVSVYEKANAQAPLLKQWDKRFGGTGDDYFTSYQQTAEGGFILGGYSLSAIGGNKSQGCWGWSDYWVLKIDSNGTVDWDKRFGGTLHDQLFSVLQSKDGGYLLGGCSASNINGDKTQLNWDQVCNPFCTYDYWVVKIDAVGNKQWDRRYGGFKDETFSTMLQNANGSYILGGYSRSGISGDKTIATRGNYDYWIVKIDSTGNKLWDNRYGGNNADYLESIKQTTDGGYILGGYSESDSSGDKSQPSWGDEDYWIVKIDSSGNKQWDKRFGGIYSDYLYCIEQTADNGYILSGKSASPVSGDKTQPTWSQSITDYWIVKTDSLGNKQWDKDFGGSSTDRNFGNLVVCKDGGYLFPGNSASPISGDKTENNLGLANTWLVKTDASGQKQWDKTIFTTGYDEIAFAIQCTDGCYLIGSWTQAGIGGYKSYPNWDSTNATRDFWIVKFCDTTLITNLMLSPLLANIALFPNPATDYLTINTNSDKKQVITICDITGKIIYSTTTLSDKTIINTKNFQQGVYAVQVQSGDAVQTRKVIVVR